MSQLFHLIPNACNVNKHLENWFPFLGLYFPLNVKLQFLYVQNRYTKQSNMKPVITFLVSVDIQGPNLEQKLPSTMESIASTEPACSLDCGPAGNCYIEQSRGDEVDVVIEDDDDGAVDLEGNTVNLRQKQETFRQRCQCPLGRGGDRCQLGK